VSGSVTRQRPERRLARVGPRSGLLEGAAQRHSPNQDERPADTRIDLIVVHGISLPPGEYGGEGIDQLFSNRLRPDTHPYYREVFELRVSSHLLIRRGGETVQFVQFIRRAWHAGHSCHQGRDRCNDFSVGIELEGTDEEPYTPIQYRRLARIISALRRAYPSIPPEGVVGHCHIAPGRKSDPGPSFRWDLLQRLRAHVERDLPGEPRCGVD
jgi:AmpD protein